MTHDDTAGSGEWTPETLPSTLLRGIDDGGSGR